MDEHMDFQGAGTLQDAQCLPTPCDLDILLGRAEHVPVGKAGGDAAESTQPEEVQASADAGGGIPSAPPPGSRASSMSHDGDGASALHEQPLQQQQQQPAVLRHAHLPIALAYGLPGQRGAVESLRPALLRQEAEGGRLLVAALLRCQAAGEVPPVRQGRGSSWGLCAAGQGLQPHPVRWLDLLPCRPLACIT